MVLEKLICAVDSVKKSAALRNDFMMLILLSQDLIVLEGHYHKRCHRVYTQKVQNLLTSSSRTNLYKDVDIKRNCEIIL